MSMKCDFIEGCPMFRYFCRSAELIYRHVYCEGDYKTCERFKLRVADQPVPENLLPQGVKLWKDGETPPDEFYIS